MKIKQFFKSTAFRSLAVLLAIVMLAGGLLAICNDLFYITDEERLARAIAKIYGDGATVQQSLNLSQEEKKYPNGEVNEAHLMSDGNYLVKSTGTGGYKDGTVTLWVVFDCEGAVATETLTLQGIDRVLYADNTNQSFINKVDERFYQSFTQHDGELKEDKYFEYSLSGSGSSGSIIVSGPTVIATSTAIVNAVNTSVLFVKKVLLKEEAKPQYAYESYVSIADSVITRSPSDNTVTYRLQMKANGPAPSFTVNVTVVNGAITAYSTEGDYGKPASYMDKVDASLRDGSKFIGMEKSEILALIQEDGGRLNSSQLEGNGLSTGATRSTESFLYAAAFALCNAQTFLEGGQTA